MPYLQAHATWGKQPPTTKSELQDVSYVFPQKKSDFFFQQKPVFFSAKKIKCPYIKNIFITLQNLHNQR